MEPERSFWEDKSDQRNERLTHFQVRRIVHNHPIQMTGLNYLTDEYAGMV